LEGAGAVVAGGHDLLDVAAGGLELGDLGVDAGEDGFEAPALGGAGGVVAAGGMEGVDDLVEYERLFRGALVGRERTDEGIRFRFRAETGLEDWVRDLAAREKACCAFFTFDIASHGDEVWLDASVVDDDLARQILDELYRLPDSVADGAAALFERFGEQGLRVMIRDEDGVLRPATPAELGWSQD
jgi:hypothetical protein